MENVYEVSNFLLPEELDTIERLMKDRKLEQEDGVLGRILFTIPVPHDIVIRMQERVEALVGRKLEPRGGAFADYSNKYGQPNLPPHFDGDDNTLIIDYQYKSNTSWGLGVDTTVFEMEDNKAIIFNPNEYPHWRPRKVFEDGEFVTMMFFRFPDKDKKTDYSHMVYSQDDEIFADIRKIRDN